MERANSAPEFPLLVYADELVEDLRSRVSKALKEWDETAIHQARVATRRLKAALDLFEPVLSKEHRQPFGRELRKLRRRLGPLRDLDVMLGHLREFDRTHRFKSAVAWLTAALLRERDAARLASQTKPSPAKVLGRLGQWWVLREELAEALEAVDVLLAESLHAQADAFAEQADRLGARGPSQSTVADGPPVDPHELRIVGKALRYTLEMAAKEGHKLPKETARVFKEMQEHLGLWHDYVVLADRMLTLAVAAQLGHHDAAAKECVLDLSKGALRKSRKQLDRFDKLWAERGQAVTEGIRAAFPLTRGSHAAHAPAAAAPPVSEPRTDRDPPDSAPSEIRPPAPTPAPSGD